MTFKDYCIHLWLVLSGIITGVFLDAFHLAKRFVFNFRRFSVANGTFSNWFYQTRIVFSVISGKQDNLARYSQNFQNIFPLLCSIRFCSRNFRSLRLNGSNFGNWVVFGYSGKLSWEISVLFALDSAKFLEFFIQRNHEGFVLGHCSPHLPTRLSYISRRKTEMFYKLNKPRGHKMHFTKMLRLR